MSKEINLEWYVLNSTYGQRENQFDQYPYCFHATDVRPWNVFNNWPFRERAIELAKWYKKGVLRKNIEKTCWGDELKEIKKLSDYELFKFKLLRELSYEEHSRCEYEICVTEWPAKKDKFDDVECDKIDCYVQVLPNADIFARYVLDTVNGRPEKELEKVKKSYKKLLADVESVSGNTL